MTVLSNYSSHVAPPGCWSLLCEVNSSTYRPRPNGDVVEAVIAGLVELGFVSDRSMIRSTWFQSLSHGYPVPMLGRDDLLDIVQSELERAGILSRGRFGGWKYEVCNQDHAFMQGVEVVDRVLLGKPEVTYRTASTG